MSLPGGVLNRTAGISRHDSDYSQDEYGEISNDWSVPSETFAVHVQALGADERAMLGSQGIEVTHRAWMNPWTGTAFTEKDRLEIDSELYQIVYIDNVAGLDHHWELILTRLMDGGL